MLKKILRNHEGMCVFVGTGREKGEHAKIEIAIVLKVWCVYPQLPCNRSGSFWDEEAQYGPCQKGG